MTIPDSYFAFATECRLPDDGHDTVQTIATN
jgi:hypothetical protein